MNRSVLISCRIKSIGKSTDRKSGVTGSSVPGCSTGAGGTGLSALMLYQNFGMSLSFNRNRVWSVMASLLVSVSPHLRADTTRRDENKNVHPTHGTDVVSVVPPNL